MITIEERRKELLQFAQSSDTDRLSRRLMDFCLDFYPGDALHNVTTLREEYNNARQLGDRNVSHDNLHQRLQDLLHSLSQQTAEVPDGKGEQPNLMAAIGISKQYSSLVNSFSFKPIDIQLRSGEITGVVGENGNGKTTLLRMLAGEISLTGGNLNFTLNDQEKADWLEIKKHVVYIPQRVPRWNGTLIENLSMVAAVKGMKGALNKFRVEFILHRLGLSNFSHLKWSELSSGYKLRFEIAKALIWQPRLLILDEPLANLDLYAQELLLEDLRFLAQSVTYPMSIILSSQQLLEVETVADHIIFLKNGRTIHNGSLAEFRVQNREKVVELNGQFSYDDMLRYLGTDHFQIEKTASGFVLRTETDWNPNAFLLQLLNDGYKVSYFRDLSDSTKKLFNDQYA